MLRNFFFPQLHNFKAYNSRIWFQKDCASSYTSNESLAVVNEMFTGKLMSRRGDIPCQDFFSESASRAAFMPVNRRQLPMSLRYCDYERLLENNTCAEMSAIPQTICQRVFTNLRFRFEECVRLDSTHLSDVILKK